jgi:hypothetical protein
MSRARLSHRLTRAEVAAGHTVVQLAPLEPIAARSDAGELAAEITASFRRTVDNYREVYKLSVQEAVDRAEERLPEYEERVLKSPPNELDWHDLRALSERDPDLALRRWEEVKQAAQDERRSGHRAARVVARDGGSCWERAQFIALHTELTEAWQPRDGQEEQLIDQMAQFQTLMERWQETLTSYTTAVGRKRRRAEREEPAEGPPRVTQAEAVQGAAAMVELMHNLYLRSLRALQNRRRANPPVIVRRAGQVNVAAQQVNICDNH